MIIEAANKAGEGVGHDYKEAVKWYRKLVEGWHILSVELRQAIVKMVRCFEKNKIEKGVANAGNTKGTSPSRPHAVEQVGEELWWDSASWLLLWDDWGHCHKWRFHWRRTRRIWHSFLRNDSNSRSLVCADCESPPQHRHEWLVVVTHTRADCKSFRRDQMSYVSRWVPRYVRHFTLLAKSSQGSSSPLVCLSW